MLLLIGVAFVAGVVTALSPCVLPALPVVLAGSAGGGARRVTGIAAGFVASFTAVTLTLGAALRAAGLSPGALRALAVAALIAFGLTVAVRPAADVVAAALAPVARLGERMPRGGSGLAGGLLVGTALGLIWTPCAGPVFAAIAAVAATGDAGARAVAVLLAYAVGAVVPLCLIALGGRRLLRGLGARGGSLARPLLGVLMVATGITVALGADVRLSAALVRDVPAYAGTLQALERAQAVDRELAGLRRPAATSIPPFLAAARGSRPTGPTDALGLPDAGPAPELRGVSATFNTGGAPLSLAGLRGRVVLVDFWTYSCINCLRTLPFLEALDRRYRDAGLTVVGCTRRSSCSRPIPPTWDAPCATWASTTRSYSIPGTPPGTPSATATGRRRTSSTAPATCATSTWARATTPAPRTTCAAPLPCPPGRRA